MSCGIPQLTNFLCHYGKAGLINIPKKVLDPIEPGHKEYALARDLKNTLAVIDRIARLATDAVSSRSCISDSDTSSCCDQDGDQKCDEDNDAPDDLHPQVQAQLSRNIHEALMAYKSAITILSNLNRSGYTENEKLYRSFSGIGKFLHQAIEPLLDDRQIREWRNDYLKPLHTIVSLDHFSQISSKSTGLKLGTKFTEHSDKLDDKFVQELYRRLGAYCQQELLPQILDAGFDPPSRIVIDLNDGDVRSCCQYLSHESGAILTEDFLDQFQRQLIDKLYNIGLEMLEERGCKINRDEALKSNLFNVSMVIVSPNYMKSSQKMQEQ